MGDCNNKYLNRNGRREVIYADEYEGVMGEEGRVGKEERGEEVKRFREIEVGARKITSSLFMYQSMSDNVNGIENLLEEARHYKRLGSIGCYLFCHSST